jgi:hypothetical protein
MCLLAFNGFHASEQLPIEEEGSDAREMSKSRKK